MKKRIILFFCLIICCFPLFANKERFYEENKILHIMYVNSVEGLRVREKPDLNSKKICTLPYRFFVKIVKIENEVVIDGIKDPWVKNTITSYRMGWRNTEIWLCLWWLSSKTTTLF